MESVRAINTRNFGRLILMSETQPRNYIPVDEADCNSMFLTSLREQTHDNKQTIFLPYMATVISSTVWSLLEKKNKNNWKSRSTAKHS